MEELNIETETLNINQSDVENKNKLLENIERRCIGEVEDDIVKFDVKDNVGNKFEKVVKITKSKLEDLDEQYYDKDEHYLKFDLFYKQQKGVKKYEVMYFTQPYKVGNNPQPLKSLLFPNLNRRHIWCFKNGNRLDYTDENVFTVKSPKEWEKNKPVRLDETKDINTVLAEKYNIDENGNIS
jgi:hypothetical protein